MAEYIERLGLIGAIKDFKVMINTGVPKMHMTQKDIMQIIEKHPAADVEEVCRCKDCKHNPGFQVSAKGMVWCRKWRNYAKLEGFCSCGERKKGLSK